MTVDTLPEKSRPKRPQPKGGSRKGIPNKVSSDVKAMILEALHHAGGAEYLCMQAFDNPKAFVALLGRVLPTTVAGDPKNPLHVVPGARPLQDLTTEEIRQALARLGQAIAHDAGSASPGG